MEVTLILIVVMKMCMYVHITVDARDVLTSLLWFSKVCPSFGQNITMKMAPRNNGIILQRLHMAL